MTKRGLIGESSGKNPVEAQRKREKEQQRKRSKFLKTHSFEERQSVHEQLSKESGEVEARAAAWKTQLIAPFSSSHHPSEHTSSTFPKPSDDPIPSYALYSIYYDAVMNPSGRSPSHKPAAYMHSDGVIRDFPPNSKPCSDNSSSDDSYASSSESDTPSQPLRPPPPRPVVTVARPPPPRPLASGKPKLMPAPP
jgi:hypothetical protein